MNALARQVHSFLRPSSSFDTRWTSPREWRTIARQRLHRWQLWNSDWETKMKNSYQTSQRRRTEGNSPAKIPGCAKKFVGLPSPSITRTPLLSELLSVGWTGTWCVLSPSKPPRLLCSVSFFFVSMSTVLVCKWFGRNWLEIIRLRKKEKKFEILYNWKLQHSKCLLSYSKCLTEHAVMKASNVYNYSMLVRSNE